MPAHNKKFALPIENNTHRKLPDNAIIDDYSYIITPRKVANDWTVKYKAKIYQILRKNYCPPKSTVYVKETFTGKIIIMFKEQNITYKLISN